MKLPISWNKEYFVAMILQPNVCLGARTSAPPNQIILLKADKNYTYVFFKDGSSILTSTNLGVLEDRLKDFNFFRANRGVLVNLDYCNYFTFQKDHSENIDLKSDRISIKVSRRRFSDFCASYPY